MCLFYIELVFVNVQPNTTKTIKDVQQKQKQTLEKYHITTNDPCNRMQQQQQIKLIILEQSNKS